MGGVSVLLLGRIPLGQRAGSAWWKLVASVIQFWVLVTSSSCISLLQMQPHHV